MGRGRTRKSDVRLRAYVYLRLSVDKEDGKAQSIEAQRHSIQDYVRRHDIEIVEEFADAGMSGESDRRPEFNRMVAMAIDGSSSVDAVLIFRIARMARNLQCSRWPW